MIYCDECEHFPPPDSKRWDGDEKRYYTCMRGQPMPFQMPLSPIDDEWGFCKQRCRFFTEKIEPPKVYGLSLIK